MCLHQLLTLQCRFVTGEVVYRHMLGEKQRMTAVDDRPLSLSAQQSSRMDDMRMHACDFCPSAKSMSGLSGLMHRCQKACAMHKPRWNKSVGKQTLEDTRTYTCPSGRSLA